LLKVYVLPADTGGCGHYRLAWPADALKRQGFDVTVVPPSKDTGFLVNMEDQDDGTKKLTSVSIPPGADVIVLQRPAHRLQPQLIQLLRSSGVAIVVDMDDDMSAIDPGNSAFHNYRHQSATDYSWRWAMESAKVATMVTTSTTALQRIYAPHGRGMTLDNYVPEATLAYPGKETGCFGWAGTTLSHPNDLQVTGDAVRRLMAQGYPFRVVGGPSKVKEKLRLTEDPVCTGTVGLENWIRTIGETVDVGMVPLAPSSFNTSKSRLKGIECMAAGVPWVASPRAEYRRLQKESGCGFLADTPKQWYTHLTRLLTNDALRAEQAEAGKDYMATQTYEAHAWRWLSAWEEALRIERGGTRPRGSA
jgi:hypothetical protein